jgi:hypothetical protein
MEHPGHGARRAAAGGVPRCGHGDEITAIDLLAGLERLAGSTYMSFGDGVLGGGCASRQAGTGTSVYAWSSSSRTTLIQPVSYGSI